MYRRLFLPICAAICLVVILGCPAPITGSVADNARDIVPPVITITSPAEYSSYSRNIVIDGVVSDLANSAGTPGQVKSLQYLILARTALKTASLDSSGHFHIVESTDLTENITFQFTAVDWDGNTSTATLPLTWVGNEIPSFSSSEGNRQTTLAWDPVPGVTGYTLYVEPSAQAPDPLKSAKIAGVTSPYVMKQLKNGSVYSFLLEGDTSDGKKNFSPVVRAVPLSTFNLLPTIIPHFNYVDVTWHVFPGIPQYEVLRSPSLSGPFLSVSGPVAAPPFHDTSIVQGSTYYYAVRPAQYSSVMSEYAEVASDPMPSRMDANISTFNGADYPQSLVYENGYLFITDYYYGLRVADVHQPSLPLPAGGLSAQNANDIAISGSYAYLTTNKSLCIIDISNPTSPVLTGSVAIPDNGGLQAEGVVVLGNLVFVAGFNDGFAVIDATDKANPVVRLSNQGVADGIGQNLSVDAQDRAGTKVLAVTGLSKTAIYTVTGTDSSPTLNLQSSTVSGGYTGRFSGTTLYVAGAGGGWSLYAYDTSTLTAPSQLGAGIAPAVGTAAAENIALDGNRAYVSLRDYGFSIIDISNPASMSLLQTYTIPGHPHGIDASGGLAYISAGSGYGVVIYGVGNASTMSLALTLTNVNTGARLAAYRDRIFVSENGSGDWKASTYDISVPSATVKTAWTSGNGEYTPYAFAFAGNHALVAAERSGIMIWDATDPSSPHGGYPWYVNLPGGYAWSIALSGNYAFVTTSGSYLDAVDLSWDGNLILAGSVQTQPTVDSNHEAAGAALMGDLAFVANEQAGLRVVDISNPQWPQVLSGYGALPASGSAAAVAAAGDCVLVADSTNGLLVFDASNARSWSAAGQAPVWPAVPSGGGALDVVVRGNFAYVAKGAAGIQIWDVSNPRSPVSAGVLSQAGFSPVRLVAYKSWLYAIDGASKLYVIDLMP